MPSSIYDWEAEQYDAWYDSPKGQAIFGEELAALQPLFERPTGSGLEVGVGSGRFAVALGAGVGVDPSIPALRLAARRGITAVVGRGEQLPFSHASFDVVLFMVALCFVADPLAALREARRVLRPGGRLAIGYVPADGSWGRYYQAQAAAGHPYYREAHFLARDELRSLLVDAGFQPLRVRSALRWPPTADVRDTGARDTGARDTGAREGDDPAAGFLALLATPTDGPSQQPPRLGQTGR